MQEYFLKNKEVWEQRTPVHIASEFYNMEKFIVGHNTLNAIELPLLGDVSNKNILHLQCHFGQDSISLARMGASVTGIDFSEQSIAKATVLSTQLQVNAKFILSNVYNTMEHITANSFDIVFTSYGTIGWLPDLIQWANVVANSLKKGGVFIMADFHPVLWMHNSDYTAIAYDYFNTKVIEEEEEGTYADTKATIENNNTYGWNHSTADLLNALLQAGMELQQFNEYGYSPYNVFNGMKEIAPSQFVFANLQYQVPMVYSLKMVKK